MRVAVISDIHANLPALNAVLADIRGLRVPEIWNLGDLIGYAPFPEEVVKVLRAEKVKSIVGNYDLKVLDFAENQKKWAQTKNSAKYFSFGWTDRNISLATREYLRNLPEELNISFDGKSFLLVHGSPERNDEALAPDTGEERFLELAAKVKADVVLCGHSHRYFAKQAANVWFANPGSVGRPFDGDSRASYALIEIKNGKLSFVNRRIVYLVEETTRKMREHNFPQELIDSISLGKSVDDLKPQPEGRDDAQVLNAVLDLAQSCHYEKEHARQVTMLALQLFDQLYELHGLGEQERLWLQAGSLLHDIGWIHGRQGHHKAGRDRILEAKDFPFTGDGRMVVALLARYHRRGLPEEHHRHYTDLTAEIKTVVKKLSALLRIADGLDRSHVRCVQDLNCQILPDKVIVRFKATGSPEEEAEAAKEKADLFSAVFGKDVLFERV